MQGGGFYVNDDSRDRSLRAVARALARPILAGSHRQEEPQAGRADRMSSAALGPSEASALIIRVDLPPALAALRLRRDENAADGVPAHVTLLYPFGEPSSIDDGVGSLVGSIVGRHAAWSMLLGERRRWPDTLYVSVEPDAPVRALQADLAAAFPSLAAVRRHVPIHAPRDDFGRRGRARSRGRRRPGVERAPGHAGGRCRRADRARAATADGWSGAGSRCGTRRRSASAGRHDGAAGRR